MMMKMDGRAFKIQKHVHSYPHSWRTDKPVLYYPLDAWFIKTTAVKDQMVALNKTITWKPESTGTGRFGKHPGLEPFQKPVLGNTAPCMAHRGWQGREMHRKPERVLC